MIIKQAGFNLSGPVYLTGPERLNFKNLGRPKGTISLQHGQPFGRKAVQPLVPNCYPGPAFTLRFGTTGCGVE